MIYCIETILHSQSYLLFQCVVASPASFYITLINVVCFILQSGLVVHDCSILKSMFGQMQHVNIDVSRQHDTSDIYTKINIASECVDECQSEWQIRNVVYCVVLCCVVLCCVRLYWVVLGCVVLYGVVLGCVVLCCMVWFGMTLGGAVVMSINWF